MRRSRPATETATGLAPAGTTASPARQRDPAPSRRPRKMLGTFVGALLLAYATLCFLAWLFEDRLTFFPSAHLAATPADVGLDFRDVWLDTAGPEERVHAWYVPHAAPRARVLFLHGNAGNISHRLDTLRVLHDLDVETLILDYPGFGRSPGTVGEEACYRAARAGLAHLCAEPGPPIVVWGRSLGGGVATVLCDGPGSERIERMVLESTFPSLPDLAARLYPWLPVRLLASNRFPSAARVATSGIPLLVVHSRDDEIVPFALGERLFEAASEPKRLVPIRGDHNGGFLESGESYLAAIRGFLDG